MVRRYGLIADTHGLVRPDALAALEGVEHVLHAGDVGGRHVLDALARVAPVSAVAGNVDPVGGELPEERRVQVGRLSVLLVHGHLQAPPTPARLLSAYADARADIIVFGHTHRPLVERVAGVLVVNPGAAGPRRFKLRPSVAILAVEDDQAVVELVELPV